MKVIFGLILFVAGIGGMGCAIWMFLGNNGGPLYWFSILVGLLSIPVTALGYVLMGQKERREQAKILGDQLSQAARHEFVRITVGIFGLVLLISSATLFIYAVTGYFWWWSNKEDLAAAGVIIMGLSAILGLPGLLLLLWGFRGRKGIGKSNIKR